MTYTGRCNCGAVTLAITGEPVAVRQCWCRQCQKVAAGGATHNAMFPVDAIATMGDLARHAYTAGSGNTLTHEFCRACGSHVFSQTSARPHLRNVRLGILDEGHGLAPNMAIWLDDAPPYAVIAPGLETFARQPPVPVKPGSGS